jgi:hypothetical protein
MIAEVVSYCYCSVDYINLLKTLVTAISAAI